MENLANSVKWLYSEAKQDSSSTRHITPHFVFHLQQGCCSHQKRQDVESVSSDKSSDRKSRTKRIVNTLGQLLTHSQLSSVVITTFHKTKYITNNNSQNSANR